jgi:hypothetical protein
MIGRIFNNFRACLLAALPLAFPAANGSASTLNVSVPGGGLSVRMNSNSGGYQIISQNPPWKFGGSLNFPVKNLAGSQGSDDLGNYRQISFDWQAGQIPMNGFIRIYDGKSLALFSQTCGAPSEMPPAAFPAFTKLPKSLHVFSYDDINFAPPEFTASDTSTPWLLFDDQANALIISPASHYMVASMLGDGHKNIASGFNPNLRDLPAGFTQQTLIALDHGINQAWDLWGHSLLALEHAQRPGNDADTVLKYLGYWTDNGAYYYYNYDLQKGYAGTLQTLVDRYRLEQIPIRYLQLDSWWYYKTTTGPDGTPGKSKKSDKLPAGEWNRYGGLLEYKAHPGVFPDGLDNFQKSIGLPLITHNRWIDPNSPYHEHYQISGIAAVDPKWWADIADYLKASGITTYEQDWLDHIYYYSPAFSSNLDTGADFLKDMSSACLQNGITMQYCMPLPCHFLQGSEYGNLTTIRTSGDRFTRFKWNNFLYTSRLADSLGIWPWADVYMSTETDNVLLSTLSAGPVGIGDAMGAEDITNLFLAVRADGMIVKPDAPIVPVDESYLADAQGRPAPLIAATSTDHNGIKTEYIFAVNRPKMPAGDVHLSSADLGLNGPAYIYDYFAGTGKLLEGSDFSAPLNADASAFYVIAPVGKSGIAFLGDKDKFVGTGKQRITSLDDQAGKLTVGISLAANETFVILHGFADVAPKAIVVSGMDDAVQYDASTHYFYVRINADTNAPLDKSAADPVRQITVVLQTRPD